ncbi:ankyrin-3 [Hetaerina americana]|uniref:ankyrin-3 n=1 Tax=Hetaerina americana TaxID=62018 RepID=UPI003A7F3E7C
MGNVISHFFQSGSALLSAAGGIHPRGGSVSDGTRAGVHVLFDALRANPAVSTHQLEGILSQIPKHENILLVHNEEGYNLLQKCVGIHNLEMVRWILSRHADVNRGACSLPLHIACLKGYVDIVEVLLKHGARIDVETRMCWPGPHNQNCEERGKYCGIHDEPIADRSSEKLQSAIFYAIDGDQVDILEMLIQQREDHWLPWQHKRPLLHIACERGAWNCVKFLVQVRSEEINVCYDEYYPIHQAALHDLKFLQLLINSGAETRVRTSTQQMTLLHVVFLLGRKSAEGTLASARLLLEHGLRDLINAPDSLGNTPLHGLIVRYALEEARFGFDHQGDGGDPPWTKWDALHLVRHLLRNGARPSINRPGNGALACVLRHVRDWEFRFELLHMLLQEGGDPGVAGRDGSVPLMVCLVPLINKDPLHHFTHTMKVCYLNCVRILCKHGANPNCSSRSTLTPLHVLAFAAGENIALSRPEEKEQNFLFVRQLLELLLRHGLNPNVRFGQRTHHVLHSLVDMVQNARGPTDLDYIYDLTLTLLRHGADPNVNVTSAPPSPPSVVGSSSRRRADDDVICHSQSSLFLRRGNHQQSSASSSRSGYPSSGSGDSRSSGGRYGQTQGPNQRNPAEYVLCQYVLLLCRGGKEEFLLDPQMRFANLIWLYYLSMGHQELYSCLKVLYTHTGAAVAAPVRGVLFNLVREMYLRPRTLKQMCRVTIYNAIGRCPDMHVSKLPLPASLKDYILNFVP